MRILLTIPDFSLHGGIRVILEWANRLSEWHEVKLYPLHFPATPSWFAIDPRVEIVGKAALGDCDLLVITSPHGIHLTDDPACPKRVVLFLQMLEHLFRPADAGWQRLCRRMYASRHPLISISQWNIERMGQEFGRTGPTYYVGNGVNIRDFPSTYWWCDKDFKTVLVEGWEATNPTKDTDHVAPRVAAALKRSGYRIVAYSAHPLVTHADVPDEYYQRPSLERLNDLYNRAAILLKASKFDARSCAPMEAMTKGTPTVRAIIHGDDDLLHEYNAVRTRYDYQDMLLGAVGLLKSPDYYFELRENCFKHLHANSWDVWMPIINDILCNA